MSKREAIPATPAERIEDVRKRIPPPEGRRSRLGYISKDDLAELIGCSRTRVIAWTDEDDPAYPEEKYRIRLAELSEGRYSPADFQAPQSPGRQAELEARVADLEKLANDVLPQLEALASRVVTLEQQQNSRQRKAGKASPS